MIEHDENEIPNGTKGMSDKEVKKMVDDFLKIEFTSKEEILFEALIKMCREKEKRKHRAGIKELQRLLIDDIITAEMYNNILPAVQNPSHPYQIILIDKKWINVDEWKFRKDHISIK